jgi:predicted porin
VVVYEREQTGTADQKNLLIGASYDFGLYKIFAQYGGTNDDTGKEKYRIFQLGTSIKVGQGYILGSYGEQHLKNMDVKVKDLTLGYDHFLSKRTDVYAIYMYDKLTNKSVGNTFAFGIRHVF